MKSINPEDLPAQECREIIADIIPTLTPGTSVIGDRILALAPKPSPWPMQLHGELVADLDNGGVSINIPAEETGFIEHQDMDRLVVAWLQHRGIDLTYILAVLAGSGLSAIENPPTRNALRSILDNAKEAETHE